MNNIYYLSHGGPGSGRYPLGSGDRPYQKFEGSRRSGGGISGYIKARRAKKAEEQQKKRQAEESRRRSELERQREEHAANREKVIRGGSASEVMKYQGELSNNELESILKRLDYEKQLKDLSQEEKQSYINRMNKLTSTIKAGTDLSKAGVGVYNLVAGIYNATEEGQKHPLKQVSLSSGGDGGKKKKKG